jgi:hypothetical protein
VSSTKATAGSQRITLTATSRFVCTASSGKLSVSLTSTAIAKSKAPKLRFVSARFYLDNGVKHTKHVRVRVHGKTKR